MVDRSRNRKGYERKRRRSLLRGKKTKKGRLKEKDVENKIKKELG